MNEMLRCGAATFSIQVENGYLESLGRICVDGKPIRGTEKRFLPWIDSFEGHVFNRFRVGAITSTGDGTSIKTRGVCADDLMLRVERDLKNRPAIRAGGWDTPEVEIDVTIRIERSEATFGGVTFSGFRYWFEIDGSNSELSIFRLFDRQTWEPGGSVQDNVLCLRNWNHPPLTRLSTDEAFSTARPIQNFNLGFVGNTYPRWAVLPAFDMQYGPSGVLLGWFDRVSLIQSIVESESGESCLRVLDIHHFGKAPSCQTNPKTVLFAPESCGDLRAANLWTEIYDQEKKKAKRYFAIERELPQQICMDHNQWVGMHFDTTYEETLAVAAEFGVDFMFIDPIWEHGEALNIALDEAVPANRRPAILDKVQRQNMCCTIDFVVGESMGGEAGLKALCDRARDQGVAVMSWISLHYSPLRATKVNDEIVQDPYAFYATDESRSHPDTGYPSDCWPIDLSTPLYDVVRNQFLETCRRTGLRGFLWDSFNNLGWSQIDFRKQTFISQQDRTGELFAALQNDGLYIRAESLVAFSGHSTLGMVNGNHYDNACSAAYSYDTQIGFHTLDGDYYENRILRGEEPIDLLFLWMSHRHVPPVHFSYVPRDEWDSRAEEEIKTLFRVFKEVRDLMVRRRVLPDNRGVGWQDWDGIDAVYFSFRQHSVEVPMIDVASGEKTLADTAGGYRLEKYRVYRFQ